MGTVSNPNTSTTDKHMEKASAFVAFQVEGESAYLKEDLPTSEFSFRIATKKTGDMRISSLRGLIWTLRYQGLRADQNKDSPLKEEKYTEAITLSEEVFRLSQFDINGYAEERASIRAALALMYTDKDMIETICQEGIEEVDKSTLAKEPKGNAKAPLYNSWGLLYGRSNPTLAIEKYKEGIECAQDNTTAKGNLYTNLSNAFKNLALDKNQPIEKREEYFAEVIGCLNLALENYPAEEEKHIKGAYAKIEDIKEKKKQFDEEKKAKKLQE